MYSFKLLLFLLPVHYVMAEVRFASIAPRDGRPGPRDAVVNSCKKENKDWEKVLITDIHSDLKLLDEFGWNPIDPPIHLADCVWLVPNISFFCQTAFK